MDDRQTEAVWSRLVQAAMDYETMNPTARGFWEKYFTPYTISLVRRIDKG